MPHLAKVWDLSKLKFQACHRGPGSRALNSSGMAQRDLQDGQGRGL